LKINSACSAEILSADRVNSSVGDSFRRPDGVVGLEIGYDQRNDVTAIFEAKGFRCLKSVKEYGQNDRVLVFALA
ncbi:hypothetical protein ACC738_38895, partial [Rhizobium ruizarguesonis]